MYETNEILLNRAESKNSVNSDVLLDVELSANEKAFPTDSISSNIDQYKQYVIEKDSSNKYRLVFTINPVCTNVLCNHITEITQETGNAIHFYGATGLTVSASTNAYVKYKYGDTGVTLNREGLIRDTGYSHKNAGNLTYYCGYDIFNNHLFRGKEFVVVSSLSGRTGEAFNTISDTLREYNGDALETITNISGNGVTHLYYKDTFRTYQESILHNLKEKDGWFGFVNPTGIDVINTDFSATTINKVINNHGACEFIDLYPDRTLFSFMPKKNGRKNREEYNWDYCLTYPYANYTGNTLVSENNGSINGILTEFCNSDGTPLISYTGLTNIDGREEFTDVTLRTKIRNNLKSGDYIRMHLVAEAEITTVYYTIKQNIKIKNVGIGGYYNMYYFTVSKDDIISGIKNIFGNDGRKITSLRCYTQRIANGRPCKYYFRTFKRIPNFKNTSINNINGLTDDQINSACTNKFNSSLNKLGFGTNIYGDRMAQILFDDDVDTTNLFDNLGRPLHEIFLTIIKTNRGHDLWYDSGTTVYPDFDTPIYDDIVVGTKTIRTIECSHCFSDVTSGIDMPWPYNENDAQDKYNVHKLHNIEGGRQDNPKVNAPVEPLESGITIDGSATLSIGDKKGLFFGDIVELDEMNVEEYVLEDVQHRFNTAQRECMLGEYSSMTHDEIVTDDYDANGFSATTQNYLGTEFAANLAPEGYYYKAHYRIPIREYSDVVNEGQHTMVKFTELVSGNNGISIGITDRNYYFVEGDKFYIYDNENVLHIGEIINVTGENLTNIVFKADISVSNTFKFFKPNILMPKTAYQFNDGSGIYRWRNIESFEFVGMDSELYDSVFTNGAHYIHKNINFFLRRQDPYGIYGLNPVYDESQPYEYQLLEQPGMEKDVTQAEHFIEGDIQLC